MRDIWAIGPTAAAHALRACGFSPRQAERLVALKLRHDRGSFRELTTPQKRLLFVRWLVAHGRLNEGHAVIDTRRCPETGRIRRSAR
jgi:hypothetical protein